MTFWTSILGGQNKTLNSDIGAFGSIAGFAQGAGQSATSTALNFDTAIASGNQAQIAKVLGPESNAIQQQKEQNVKSTAEFGNRSGGTNSSMQMAGDKATASLNDLIASLTGSSVANLGSMGSNLLSTALSGYNSQMNASQLQMQNWADSILGRGVTTAAAFGESYGLNYLGSLGSGGES